MFWRPPAEDDTASLGGTTVATERPLTQLLASHLRSYDSCPSFTAPPRVKSPTQLTLANYLMDSTNNSLAASDESPPHTAESSAAVDTKQQSDDVSTLAGETIEVEGASDDAESTNITLQQKLANMANRVFSPLVDRLLNQRVAADRLSQYSLLALLSQNGRYAALGLLAVFIVFTLLIWIPLWILAQLITEVGVYLFLLTSAVYGGRCLLRLLAFPGTNVRVYGEIESEFAKYSVKMLEGAAGAIEDFVKSILAGGSNAMANAPKASRVLGDNNGWEIVDVPATHKRMMVYKRRVLGVYWEVLHCLLEESGQGYNPIPPMLDTNGTSDGNGFYRVGENISACRDTCKRNLCCERQNTGERSMSDMEGIQLDISHSPSSESLGDQPTLSRYGNNRLVGDIGNMVSLTAQAKSDGRELYTLLSSLLNDLSELESSSSNILRVMNDKDQLRNATPSAESMEQATKVNQRVGELRDVVSRIKLTSDTDNNDEDEQQRDEESEMGAEAVRNRLEEQGTASSSSSVMGMVWSAVQAFVSMIDPPPHKSIFGLDVIRGTFLTRYRGAKQFWVKRSSGCAGDGKLDVILVPSSTTNEESNLPVESMMPLSPRKGREEDVARAVIPEQGNNVGKKRKAVLYCNPNAGLVEVATGMGLIGGNVGSDEDGEDKESTCWTEYYIEHGFDVYLFNYAGYGRSYGGSSWNETAEFSHGVLGVLKRVFFSTFLAFKPTSESLKSDAAAVARHLVDVIGVDELIIHGESIGGMAAAGAARALTATTTAPKPSTLLICDRTFTNLEAVAQRLVGQWTGSAIRLLTPSWSTDVARDFLAAKCPKIVAQDADDEIIHDYSSLKVGLSFAGELTKGQTNNVGWIMSAPVEYCIADVDNVSITDSRIACKSFQVKSAPTWSADKRITWSEAFHFAACSKRIGKLATAAKKRIQMLEEAGLASEEAEGIELLYSADASPQLTRGTGNGNGALQTKSDKALVKLWSSLACCDGLCGHPLGHAVKEGFDCTVAWLCSTVVFGGQVLAERAEQRWDKEGSTANDSRVFLPDDFDGRPRGYQWDEDELTKHPVPIPELISTLKEMSAQKNALKEVESELAYVVGMLEYIAARLTSKESSDQSSRRRNGREEEQGVIATGCFLNLHCGHNNQYSTEEREKLMALIRRSSSDSA